MRAHDRQPRLVIPGGLPAGHPVLTDKQKPGLLALDLYQQMRGAVAFNVQRGTAAISE